MVRRRIERKGREMATGWKVMALASGIAVSLLGYVVGYYVGLWHGRKIERGHAREMLAGKYEGPVARVEQRSTA